VTRYVFGRGRPLRFDGKTVSQRQLVGISVTVSINRGRRALMLKTVRTLSYAHARSISMRPELALSPTIRMARVGQYSALPAVGGVNVLRMDR